MEVMELEQSNEYTEVVADCLATPSCTEQLELNIGLTTAERRMLNARAIMRALEHGQYVSLAEANPKICGTETAGIVMRAQLGTVVSGL